MSESVSLQEMDGAFVSSCVLGVFREGVLQKMPALEGQFLKEISVRFAGEKITSTWPGPSAEMRRGFLLYKFWRILPGIFLEDFSEHFFPTKMRRKNPATKSGGSKTKIREKPVLPKAVPKKTHKTKLCAEVPLDACGRCGVCSSKKFW